MYHFAQVIKLTYYEKRFYWYHTIVEEIKLESLNDLLCKT